jgi:hypothetical protein
MKKRSGSLSLILPDCGGATTSLLNSSSFKDGGVFVVAVLSPGQSSSQRLEHRRMSRSAAISTVRNQF